VLAGNSLPERAIVCELLADLTNDKILKSRYYRTAGHIYTKTNGRKAVECYERSGALLAPTLGYRYDIKYLKWRIACLSKERSVEYA